MSWESKFQAQPKAQPQASGQLTIPGVTAGGQSTFGTAAGRAYYMPIIVNETMSFTGVYWESSLSNTANVRIAIYNADQSWQPGSLVIDLGETSDSVGVHSIATSFDLDPGNYLVRMHFQAAGGVRRVTAAPVTGLILDPALSTSPFIYIWYKDLTYAAAEDPGTAWDSTASTNSSGFYYFVFFENA